MKYKSQHLHATSIELVLELCESTQLRRAHWCEVGRVGEQNCPFAVKELVKLDLPMCCLRLEVRCDGSNSQSWLLSGNGKTAAERRDSRVLKAQRWADGGAESSRSCTGDENRHCGFVMVNGCAVRCILEVNFRWQLKVDSMAMASSPRGKDGRAENSSLERLYNPAGLAL